MSIKLLERIYEKLNQADKDIDFSRILQFELKPCILGSKVFKAEFNRRVDYILELSKSESYKMIITSIHKKLVEIHSSIDPKLLNKEANQSIPYKGMVSLVDLHKMLNQQSEWQILQSSNLINSEWKTVFTQYETVGMFYRLSKDAFISDNGNKLTIELMLIVKELQSLLEEPFYNLYIEAFDHVNFCFNSPDHFLHNTNSLEHVRKNTLTVCSELIFFLENKGASSDSKNQTSEFIEDHGLKIWKLREEVECAGLKKTLSKKNWGIVIRCLRDPSWATDCSFLLNDGKTLNDVDANLKDLNKPWKNTGWKIARRKSKNILLGAAEKRKPV